MTFLYQIRLIKNKYIHLHFKKLLLLLFFAFYQSGNNPKALSYVSMTN